MSMQSKLWRIYVEPGTRTQRSSSGGSAQLSHLNITTKKDNGRSTQIHCEIYRKSPFIRGNKLWKQLTSERHHAKTKIEFDRLLTEDLILHLES